MVYVDMPKFLDSPHLHAAGEDGHKRWWLDDDAPEEIKKEFEAFEERERRLREQGILC